MNNAKKKKPNLFCFLSYSLFLPHSVPLTYSVQHAVVLKNFSQSWQVQSTHQSIQRERQRERCKLFLMKYHNAKFSSIIFFTSLHS